MSSINLPSIARLATFVLCAIIPAAALAASSPLGIFDGQQDVGTILHHGSVRYNRKTGAYTVSGSGQDMWAGTDQFHFVWKKMSGDVALTADIALLGPSKEPHRKAVIIIRQNLDGGSPGVDVAVHGNGLASMQFRATPGANLQEIQSNVTAPQTVRIEKRGDLFYAFVTGPDGKLVPAGASIRLALTGPFYVGIGVCAHNKNGLTRDVFSYVHLDQLQPATGKPVLVSALETVPIATGDRHVEYVAAAHFEAPNWSRDGSFLIFNQGGSIYELTLGAGQPAPSKPTLIDTAPETHCNNDHGISPDGTMLAISDSSMTDRRSRVYIVPISGGTPRQLTPDGPSYWHGWSPDGKTLAFTGERGDNFDIYTVPVEGGAETRLTTAAGLDDGPEYSPDGVYLYFNSERTGQMQIWRMKADGSDQEQVISDDTNDWFPHISPDGQWMEFLAYDKSVTGHPGEKNVQLMLMSMTDKKVRVLASLFGGQGTINVPSWSPDSKRIAFVSYEQLPAEDISAQ